MNISYIFDKIIILDYIFLNKINYTYIIYSIYTYIAVNALCLYE